MSGLGGWATCGPLWRKAVAPIQYHAQSLWLAGWMAGWLDGWLAGWMNGGGRHHHCNLARSTPRRVGGFGKAFISWRLFQIVGVGMVT